MRLSYRFLLISLCSDIIVVSPTHSCHSIDSYNEGPGKCLVYTVCVQIFVGRYFCKFCEFMDIRENKNAKITHIQKVITG